MDPGQAQSQIIVETAKAFERYGLNDVEIIGSDETSPDKAIEAYESYSEEAKASLDRISTHTYSSNGSKELGELAKLEGFNLWMSEVDGGETSGVRAGDMGSALWIAEKIIDDINSLSPSAWVMWQVIDNHISDEGYNGNKDTGMVNLQGGFWGAAVADHNREKIILTQKYYAIGQFTRYIRPGATIIHCGDASLAAYDEERQELVIVVINSSDKDLYCQFNLSAFDKVGKEVKVVRTSGSVIKGESWAELENIQINEKKFVGELKSNSITTYIISDVNSVMLSN